MKQHKQCMQLINVSATSLTTIDYKLSDVLMMS